jgi:hypothetical protein
MSKSNVSELEGQEQLIDPLTELLKKGAEQLIFRAVDAELQELLREHSDRRTEDGKTGVVRNGYQPERELQTGVGPVTVRIPKVRSKGSSAALAVFKGDINGRDERGIAGIGRAECKRVVAVSGVKAETGVGR